MEEKLLHKLLDSRVKTLENGLEIVTVKKDTQLMSINIGIKIGSIHEEKKERGISHFIEHMIFKGTKNRDNHKIIHDLEQLGGGYEAYTDNVATVYTVSALSEEFSNALEIFQDMIMNSEFPKEEIEKERGVILSEIRTSYDDTEDYSFRKVKELAFTNSNLKYDVLGDKESVKKFNRKDFITFYNKYYVPNNAVIVVVSPFEHDYMEKEIEKCFGSWKKKELNKIIFKGEINKPCVNKVNRNEIEQSSIIYLYSIKELSFKERLALKALNFKLGGSSNSILVSELREKRGLCYDVYSSMSYIEELNMIYIYAAVNKEDIEEAVEIINSSINSILNKKINFDHNVLKLMKKGYKTETASTLESCDDIGQYLIESYVENEDMYLLQREIDTLDKLTSEDIYKVSEKILHEPTINILVGKE